MRVDSGHPPPIPRNAWDRQNTQTGQAEKVRLAGKSKWTPLLQVRCGASGSFAVQARAGSAMMGDQWQSHVGQPSETEVMRSACCRWAWAAGAETGRGESSPR